MRTPKTALIPLVLSVLLSSAASAAPQAGGILESAAREVGLLIAAGALALALFVWLLRRRAQ
jgi:hypothetical protein